MSFASIDFSFSEGETIDKSSESLMQKNPGDKPKEHAFMKLKEFHVVMQGLFEEFGYKEFKWGEDASKALLHGVHEHFIGIFEDSWACAEHGRRVTLQIRDLFLARKIRSRFECVVGSMQYLNN
jgi:histone H3/H4